MGLTSVLPFLAALQKQVIPSQGFVGNDENPVDPVTLKTRPTMLKQQALQAQPDVQPDLSVGQPPPPPPQPQPTPQPTDNVPDLAQSMTQGQGAPKFHETKGHALMRILQSGVQGGLNGMAANSQTYAATGRNAGFGGGFSGATTVPLEQQMLRNQVQFGGLQNQQLAQMLPFLRAQTMAGLFKTQAEAQKANAEAGAVPYKTNLEQAQAEAAFYKEDPNLGLIDIRTGQPVNPSGLAPLTPEEAQVLGKTPGERVPLKLKNTANEIVNRGFTTVNTEEGVYERNRGTGSMTRLGSNPRMMFAPGEKYVPVVEKGADGKPTGNIVYQKVGEAAKTGSTAPSSIDFQNQKSVTKEFTVGGSAKTLNAFNTATEHLKLLSQLSDNLDNASTPVFNQLKNLYERETGSSAPTSFQMAKNAVAGEIAKTFKGNATEGEIGAINETINSAMSPMQLKAAIQTALDLMGSKKKALQTQYENGMNAQPAFGDNNGPTAADLLKKYPPNK